MSLPALDKPEGKSALTTFSRLSQESLRPPELFWAHHPPLFPLAVQLSSAFLTTRPRFSGKRDCQHTAPVVATYAAWSLAIICCPHRCRRRHCRRRLLRRHRRRGRRRDHRQRQHRRRHRNHRFYHLRRRHRHRRHCVHRGRRRNRRQAPRPWPSSPSLSSRRWQHRRRHRCRHGRRCHRIIAGTAVTTVTVAPTGTTTAFFLPSPLSLPRLLSPPLSLSSSRLSSPPSQLSP